MLCSILLYVFFSVYNVRRCSSFFLWFSWPRVLQKHVLQFYLHLPNGDTSAGSDRTKSINIHFHLHLHPHHGHQQPPPRSALVLCSAQGQIRPARVSTDRQDPHFNPCRAVEIWKDSRPLQVSLCLSLVFYSKMKLTCGNWVN